MLSSKTKILAAGLSAAFLTMHAPVQAQTINLGVAANFYSAALELADNFVLAYPSPFYSFTTTKDSSGNLETAIINGNPASYDIFFSADTTRPNDLYTNHNSLVIGTPFFYATGSLMLASKTVDISGGLPSTLNDAFVIADPTKAPYGAAAVSVLNSSPWSLGIVPGTTTFPDGYVNIRADISLTFSAISNGSPPDFDYGFVAKSATCADNLSGTVTNNIGRDTNVTTSTGYFHEYAYNGTPTYPQIVQDGIEINISGRATADETEIENFIAYVTGNYLPEWDK
jgi:molybdate transport system substrate-binding protein